MQHFNEKNETKNKPEIDIFFQLFQQLEHLKNDNQRLRDENGALIRVISKLSK